MNLRDKATLFAVVSGDFPTSGIAVPVVERKFLKGIFRELVRYKGRALRDRCKLHLAAVFASRPLLKLIAKRTYQLSGERGVSELPALFRDYIFPICVSSRKYLLPLFRKNSGEFSGYAKAYRKGGIEERCGRNEVGKLKALQDVRFDDAAVPRVVREGESENFYFYALSTERGLKKYRRAGAGHVRWLSELAEKTGSVAPFRESPYGAYLGREVKFLSERIPRSADTVNYFYERAVEYLREKNFLFSLTLREFSYFQPLHKGNEFFALDWEYAEYGFPPVFDFYSLMISDALRRVREARDEDYEAALRKTFFGKGGTTRSAKELFARYGLDDECAYWFFWLFLIDQLYIHLQAGHDGSAKRIIAFLENARERRAELHNIWLQS